MKFGILADTHITSKQDSISVINLIEQLKKVFRDVDEIIHVGNINDSLFLNELNKIAPTKIIKGEKDLINNLPTFRKFSVGRYNIGVIHKLPKNLELFCKENKLHILITGHTHQPLIKTTPFNTLLLNPGSPTQPKAPPKRKGFDTPVARPSVITLNIDKEDILTTYLINLNL